MASHVVGRRAFCAGLTATAAVAATSGAWAEGARKSRRHLPEVIGRMGSYVTRYEDTLLDLAPKHHLGYVEMVAANPGVEPWVPGDGTHIVLPTQHVLPDGPRRGILLNVADMRLYFFPKDRGGVESYPIGTGRQAWNTPLGTTTIVRKVKNPTWYVPKSIRATEPDLPAVVPHGPDNPLGDYAFYLGWPSYLIHGTNKPLGVGRRASHGCTRMYPADIAQLFPRIPVGTQVTVVNQPVKIGRVGETLYLEAHPTLNQADQIEAGKPITPTPAPEAAHRLMTAAGDQAELIDWPLVNRTISERRGYPVAVIEAARAASSRS